MMNRWGFGQLSPSPSASAPAAGSDSIRKVVDISQEESMDVGDTTAVFSKQELALLSPSALQDTSVCVDVMDNSNMSMLLLDQSSRAAGGDDSFFKENTPRHNTSTTPRGGYNGGGALGVLTPRNNNSSTPRGSSSALTPRHALTPRIDALQPRSGGGGSSSGAPSRFFNDSLLEEDEDDEVSLPDVENLARPPPQATASVKSEEAVAADDSAPEAVVAGLSTSSSSLMDRLSTLMHRTQSMELEQLNRKPSPLERVDDDDEDDDAEYDPALELSTSTSSSSGTSSGSTNDSSSAAEAPLTALVSQEKPMPESPLVDATDDEAPEIFGGATPSPVAAPPLNVLDDSTPLLDASTGSALANLTIDYTNMLENIVVAVPAEASESVREALQLDPFTLAPGSVEESKSIVGASGELAREPPKLVEDAKLVKSQGDDNGKPEEPEDDVPVTKKSMQVDKQSARVGPENLQPDERILDESSQVYREEESATPSLQYATSYFPNDSVDERRFVAAQEVALLALDQTYNESSTSFAVSDAPNKDYGDGELVNYSQTDSPYDLHHMQEVAHSALDVSEMVPMQLPTTSPESHGERVEKADKAMPDRHVLLDESTAPDPSVMVEDSLDDDDDDVVETAPSTSATSQPDVPGRSGSTKTGSADTSDLAFGELRYIASIGSKKNKKLEIDIPAAPKPYVYTSVPQPKLLDDFGAVDESTADELEEVETPTYGREGDPYAWAYEVWKRHGLLPSKFSPRSKGTSRFESKVAPTVRDNDITESDKASPREAIRRRRLSMPTLNFGGKSPTASFANILRQWRTASDDKPNTHFLSPDSTNGYVAVVNAENEEDVSIDCHKDSQVEVSLASAITEVRANGMHANARGRRSSANADNEEEADAVTSGEAEDPDFATQVIDETEKARSIQAVSRFELTQPEPLLPLMSTSPVPSDEGQSPSNSSPVDPLGADAALKSCIMPKSILRKSTKSRSTTPFEDRRASFPSGPLGRRKSVTKSRRCDESPTPTNTGARNQFMRHRSPPRSRGDFKTAVRSVLCVVGQEPRKRDDDVEQQQMFKCSPADLKSIGMTEQEYTGQPKPTPEPVAKPRGRGPKTWLARVRSKSSTPEEVKSGAVAEPLANDVVDSIAFTKRRTSPDVLSAADENDNVYKASESFKIVALVDRDGNTDGNDACRELFEDHKESLEEADPDAVDNDALIGLDSSNASNVRLNTVVGCDTPNISGCGMFQCDFSTGNALALLEGHSEFQQGQNSVDQSHDKHRSVKDVLQETEADIANRRSNHMYSGEKRTDSPVAEYEAQIEEEEDTWTAHVDMSVSQFVSESNAAQRVASTDDDGPCASDHARAMEILCGDTVFDRTSIKSQASRAAARASLQRMSSGIMDFISPTAGKKGTTPVAGSAQSQASRLASRTVKELRPEDSLFSEKDTETDIYLDEKDADGQLKSSWRTSRASLSSVGGLSPDGKRRSKSSPAASRSRRRSSVESIYRSTPPLAERGAENTTPWIQKLNDTLQAHDAPAAEDTDAIEVDEFEQVWTKDMMIQRVNHFSPRSDKKSSLTVRDGICQCSSSVFSENDELIEFFLPLMGMACTCNRRLQALNNPDEPTSLENILRPWQVQFLAAFGIYRGDQLVKAHHRSANALARALRQHRRKYAMTPFRTKSCGMALQIWSKTSKAFVRSIRKQQAEGEKLELPNTLWILSSFVEQLPTRGSYSPGTERDPREQLASTGQFKPSNAQSFDCELAEV